MLTLDKRLMTLAEWVGLAQTKTCIDIGCDHGRLGAFLLQMNWADKVIFSDISAPSLEKAKRLVRLMGLDDRAAFLVSDGVQALDVPVDCAVIAGMGGTTAATIIEHGRDRLKDARLLVQANVAVPELRMRLSSCGYRIQNEALVQDGRRFYVLMSALPGKSSYTPYELHVGPILSKTLPPAMKGYTAFRLRVARKAYEGACAGGDREGMTALENEIAIWEEAEKCL